MAARQAVDVKYKQGHEPDARLRDFLEALEFAAWCVPLGEFSTKHFKKPCPLCYATAGGMLHFTAWCADARLHVQACCTTARCVSFTT